MNEWFSQTWIAGGPLLGCPACLVSDSCGLFSSPGKSRCVLTSLWWRSSKGLWHFLLSTLVLQLFTWANGWVSDRIHSGLLRKVQVRTLKALWLTGYEDRNTSSVPLYPSSCKEWWGIPGSEPVVTSRVWDFWSWVDLQDTRPNDVRWGTPVSRGAEESLCRS